MPSLTEKLKLALEWLPVLQMLPAIAAAEAGQKRTLEILRLAEMLSAKTDTTLDDRLVRLLIDILLTPQGGALIDYLAGLVREMSDEPNAS